MHEADLLQSDNVVGGVGSGHFTQLRLAKKFIRLVRIAGCRDYPAVYDDLYGLIYPHGIPDTAGANKQNKEQSERQKLKKLQLALNLPRVGNIW